MGDLGNLLLEAPATLLPSSDSLKILIVCVKRQVVSPQLGPCRPQNTCLGPTSHQYFSHGILAGPRSQRCLLTSLSLSLCTRWAWTPSSSSGSSLPGFTVSVNDSMNQQLC